MPDRRLYDFVETECGRIAFHWFPSYFPFIIFIQAIALIVVDNIWLTLPEPSAIVDHFLSLVVECYNTSGTSLALWTLLWRAKVLENTGQGLDANTSELYEDPEQGTHEKQALLGKTSQPTIDGSIQSSTASLNITEADAVKAEALYEKVGLFRNEAEEKKLFSLYVIYCAQAMLQFIISCSFFGYQVHNHSTFKNNAMCKIDYTISEDYNHFICTDFLVPFFGKLHTCSCVLLAAYCNSSILIWVWVLKFVFKEREEYNFVSERRINRGNSNDTRTRRREDIAFSELQTGLQNQIDPAHGDLAFLLHLLNNCNKLYMQRFSIFLSEKNEQVIKDFILMTKWPVERFKKNCRRRCRRRWSNIEISQLIWYPENGVSNDRS